MDKNKTETNKELSFLECIKVIFITLVGILIPSVTVGFVIHTILKINLMFGSIIGAIIVVILIFALGLHKPASANEYKENDDEDDD